MPNDIWDDPDLKAYLEHARREMFPKLKGSILSMIILNSEPDPKLCLELGAAILFNKPLLVLAIKGQPVPPMLRAIAREVVEIDGPNDLIGQARVKKALESIAQRPA